ncbi:protein crumbs-like isoform X1 [Haliotis rufescens]|uniref:protein crumbs-like isoform X1 n=1 Tax=Haliotis rufescens TaxID=6454 RepID=UPI00201EAE8E|nr:protein crumbs-like isoform X1 [Haliotis rufescens]
MPPGIVIAAVEVILILCVGHNKAASSLYCRSCVDVHSPASCTNIRSCKANQMCSTREMRSLNGDVVYTLGCDNSDVCSSHVLGPVIGRRASSGCFQCCGSNECNAGLCALQPPTTPHSSLPIGVVDHCNPNHCANGGTCVERVDGFVCECASGYTGMNCNISDLCASDPCLHGGKCLDTKTSYVCDCTGTGYDGFTCQVPYDDCLSQPCLHGSTCIDGFKNWTCKCVAGFAGNNCEVELSACVSNPCLHGGTCVDTHAGSNPGQTSPGFHCQCVEGIAGDRCETNYDDCWVKPCKHGTCVDGINSYTCDCTGSGYSGVLCEHKLTNQCLNHPCQNGGTCIQDGDDYHCECLAFKEGLITHGGKNCSVLLRGCENVHACQNKALCVPVLLNEAKNINGYTCSCAHGFIGAVCDTTTIMTVSPSTFIRKTYSSGFNLTMRFRTGQSNGVLLYNRVGNAFVSVEIVNGSLYLVSGDTFGYNDTQEALTSLPLDDSQWHSLSLVYDGNTTLSLMDPLCNTTDDCILSSTGPTSASSLREHFIGRVPVTPWRQGTVSKRDFDGCVEDVIFNSDVIIPDNYGVAEFHGIKMDCPACLPGTCDGIGKCYPRGNTSFQCCAGIHNGVCFNDNGVTCNFDAGLCGWVQSGNDVFDWTRFQGATGSTDTGPSGDHTSGSGYYMYTEASSPRSQGDTASLLSPRFDVTSKMCLQFYAHMVGSTMGSLEVYEEYNGQRTTLFTKKGSQSGQWFPVSINLLQKTNVLIEIKGTVGNGYYSDMAIDDVFLLQGTCP